MSLKRAHDRIAEIFGDDIEIEPLSVARLVERQREAWKPSTVRVVMLAESHVWTSPEETKCRVRGEGLKGTGFTRFVYCLGYGEPSLVKVAKNDGTLQYWKLFHYCMNGPNAPYDYLTRSATSDQQRIQAKLLLLRRMQESGLWLVDASITALYRKGPLLRGRTYTEVLQRSWDSHVRDIVTRSGATAMLVVGKSVWRALAGRLLEILLEKNIKVICQPQGTRHLSGEKRLAEIRGAHRFCSRHLPLTRKTDRRSAGRKPFGAKLQDGQMLYSVENRHAAAEIPDNKGFNAST
jgi:hypothetical protein